MGVKILTDSTSYIDEQIIADLDINIISLNVIFEDESFKETDLDKTGFYEMMDDKGIPSSSQPSVDELHYQMEKIIESGDDLLCIFLSSNMSTTYSTANIASNKILKSYKYRSKIEVIDSRSNSMQLGFAVIVAARAAKQFRTLEQVKLIAKHNIKRSRVLFIPNNLKYLEKGGRIGAASALIGDIFEIIPILTVEDGVVEVLTKVRTKKKAIITMVDKMLEDTEEYGLIEIVVQHTNCYEEAKELADDIGKKLNRDISICELGPVIGLHVGPGALSIAYYTEKNIRK